MVRNICSAEELAKIMVNRGSPEKLYDVAESFPVGDPARMACLKIAAILSRMRPHKTEEPT